MIYVSNAYAHSFGPKSAFEIKKNIIALENLHVFFTFISTYLHINSVQVEQGIQINHLNVTLIVHDMMI